MTRNMDSTATDAYVRVGINNAEEQLSAMCTQ